MKNLFLIIVFFMVSQAFCSENSSAYIRVYAKSPGQLVYQLSGADILDQKTKSQLGSGIAVKVFMLARLIRLPSQMIESQMHAIEVRYDLWEEVYNISIDSQKKFTEKLRSKVEDYLASPGPFIWSLSEDLNTRDLYRIQITETVNPLSVERLNALQKWLSERNTQVRDNPVRSDSNRTQWRIVNPFSVLFDSLWKKANEGDIQAGEVQKMWETQPFGINGIMLKEKRE